MVFVLIVLAAASRLLPHPPNFAPVAAIGLFAGAYCWPPRRLAGAVCRTARLGPGARLLHAGARCSGTTSASAPACCSGSGLLGKRRTLAAHRRRGARELAGVLRAVELRHVGDRLLSAARGPGWSPATPRRCRSSATRSVSDVLYQRGAVRWLCAARALVPARGCGAGPSLRLNTAVLSATPVAAGRQRAACASRASASPPRPVAVRSPARAHRAATCTGCSGRGGRPASRAAGPAAPAR